MIERLRKRGEKLAASRLARVRSEVGTVLADEVPDDIRIEETAGGVLVTGRRLHERLIDYRSLRDIGFLIRGAR